MPDKLTSARLERLGRSYSGRKAAPTPSVCTVRGSPPPTNRRFSSPPVNSIALTSSPPRSPRPRVDSLELTRRRGVSLCSSPAPSAQRSPSPSPSRRPQAASSILRNYGRQARGGNTADDLLLVTSSALKELEKGPKPQTSNLGRGLCAICQDNEATMAAVGCGHLAMCKGCSQAVLKTSRACPLCRKHIAEARLIRIFKT
ncbi:hypothetical protein B0H12DRAFT_1149284 [Mycena haematopus]|nr:hypothetical protein B0H12DRAFT_1149284 [Mycena haematopus]